MEYMQQVMDEETSMGDTLRGTSNIRCPFDFSQVSEFLWDEHTLTFANANVKAGWQLTGTSLFLFY